MSDEASVKLAVRNATVNVKFAVGIGLAVLPVKACAKLAIFRLP